MQSALDCWTGCANKVPICLSGYDASTTPWVVLVLGLTDYAITARPLRVDPLLGLLDSNPPWHSDALAGAIHPIRFGGWFVEFFDDVHADVHDAQVNDAKVIGVRSGWSKGE